MLDLSMVYATMLVGAVMGVILGIIPAAVGIYRNRKALGAAGFAACGLLGAVGGIFLSVPLAILFTVIIMLLKKEETI